MGSQGLTKEVGNPAEAWRRRKNVVIICITEINGLLHSNLLTQRFEIKNKRLKQAVCENIRIVEGDQTSIVRLMALSVMKLKQECKEAF